MRHIKLSALRLPTLEIAAVVYLSVFGCAAWAQVLSLGVKPVEPIGSSALPKPKIIERTRTAGAPLFGYVQGPAAAELRAITGKPNAPQLTADLVLPENAAHLYLAPRGLYALVESGSDHSISVWMLGGRADVSETPAVIGVPGLTARPDLIAFSPRGRTAVCYTEGNGSLRVIQDLPTQPALAADVSLSGFGVPTRIAVSDDASVLAAVFADGRMMVHPKEGEWKNLATVFSPAAWSFVPNTHDLVISDTTQKVIVLLPQVETLATSYRFLAEGLKADHLAVAKDGAHMAAAQIGDKSVWTIGIGDGSIVERQEQTAVESVTPLRDGFSFLLSTSPAVSIVSVGAAAPADSTNSTGISH